MNGIERLVRILVVTRRNHPLSIFRPSYQKKGPNFTSTIYLFILVHLPQLIPCFYLGYGVTMRCVREDETSQTITIHYQREGGIMVKFSLRKQEYLVPFLLIVKALKAVTDRQVYESIVGQMDAGRDPLATASPIDDSPTISDEEFHTFMSSRVESMLREFSTYSIADTPDNAKSSPRHALGQRECLAFLGSKFGAVFKNDDSLDDVSLGKLLLSRVLLVHLTKNEDKYNMLMFMARKLYSVACGHSLPDNPDSPMHHELLTGGSLYGAYIKEKLEEMLSAMKQTVMMEISKNGFSFSGGSGESSVEFKKLCWQKCSGVMDIGKKCAYFLGTGNLASQTGMDLSQTSGYTVVAERLNFLRFLSHFRSVHRGSFFAELKTTTVRKLMPESWGFFCPVHTPDGAPCGLLNHLTHQCRVVNVKAADAAAMDDSGLVEVLVQLGLSTILDRKGSMPVILDGKLIGSYDEADVDSFVRSLRLLKSQESTSGGMAASVPWNLEIAAVTKDSGVFKGLFLASTPARMMRPVLNTVSNRVEWIGIYEQVFLPIKTSKCKSLSSEDLSMGYHKELMETNILSVVGNLTPFSEFNQSPRNMYQCQMGKQTMGTPCHAFPFRSDNKLFRLMHGQSPIVRPALHSTYGFDNYPNGCNAVVGVLAYSGYDMEDAMIINKSAHERGFGMAEIYKTEVVDLGDLYKNNHSKGKTVFFACFDVDILKKGTLDIDGFPPVGITVKPGDVIASIFDPTSMSHKFVKYKAFENAIVEGVVLCGSDDAAPTNGNTSTGARRANIKFRIPRAPVIGDKFSSRHGQKGVCSQKYYQMDLPFSSQGGLTPDVIINPNAFPSRMTIGMLLESMAGKLGALKGCSIDATPWLNSGKDSEPLEALSDVLDVGTLRPTNEHLKAKGGKSDKKVKAQEPEASKAIPKHAYERFGEQLKDYGYSYYGNETMYSGVTGKPLKLDIYFGVVYYQRLRHMVNDKFQVRTTGPIHNLTHQPIKGRKRAGGIRFGEMERDSLIAHGTAFLLNDRLMNCSDYTQMWVCKTCGGILSVISTKVNTSRTSYAGTTEQTCLECGDNSDLTVIALPYVYRYLAAELLSMNVRLTLAVM